MSSRIWGLIKEKAGPLEAVTPQAILGGTWTGLQEEAFQRVWPEATSPKGKGTPRKGASEGGSCV